MVEKFNKLEQKGSLESYVDEFEDVRSLMLQQNHLLPNSYFLDSSVRGLKPTLKSFVRAFKPISISSAIEYARLQEDNIEATEASYKPFYSAPKTVNKPPLLPTPNTYQKPSSFSPRPQINLSPAERMER